MSALGRGPRFLHRAIREIVHRLDDDRPCGVDVEAVHRDVLGSHGVRSALRTIVGGTPAVAGGASTVVGEAS